LADPGRSFGAEAEAYERGRPEWPEELLDLGAGTGKLTRVLEWRYALDGAPFPPLREVGVGQGREVPRAELLDDFASISPVTSLPAGDRARWLERLAAALDRPSYGRRWTALLYWTRLR
jgi:hypothetical protein